MFLFIFAVVLGGQTIEFRRTNSGLTEIPDDIPSDVRLVFLDNNLISNVSAHSFSHLASCTDLSLHNNDISDIQDGAFWGLKSLQKLWLQGNSISELKGWTY